ncbi:MAG: hypothetical protein H0X40_19630 [Chthoniobacterales bacterium]|nr:hypothetical protein [Chthoniobacterales bacterium]
MKKVLLFSALFFAASAGASFGQTISTTLGNPRVTLPAPSPSATPKPNPAARGGSIPTAIRHGNPLHLLNPRAPTRYGTSQQHTNFDPNDPGKPRGVALFEWTF